MLPIRMSRQTRVAEAAPEAAPLPGGDLRRDYVTTFLTEVLVITSYLVAFRLVAVHLGQNGFGEYALSRRTLSLVSPLAVLGLDVAIARFVAYAMGRRTGREAGYPGAALLIIAVTLAILSAFTLFSHTTLFTASFWSARNWARRLASFASP